MHINIYDCVYVKPTKCRIMIFIAGFRKKTVFKKAQPSGLLGFIRFLGFIGFFWTSRKK